MANSASCKIRMYRLPELGDCFLLQFNDGKNSSDVLIDCGSFRNSNKSAQFLNKVADNIKQTTGPKGLDLVIATHQHNDHMSGFKHAQKVFDNMPVQQVFLSWLDDPKDPIAKDILKKQKKIQAEFARFMGLLKSRSSKVAKNLRENMLDLVDTLSIDGNSVTSIATEYLRTRGERPIKYVSPGETLHIPGVDPDKFKMHILGPPKNYKSIRDTSPNKGESYDPHLNRIMFSMSDFISALESKGEDHYPFNFHYKNKLSKNDPALKSYHAQEWRKIDDDWLILGERLGLHLNSYTNNTSIAIAFELVESSQFLLFVGDAQVGNWKTWDQIDRGTTGPDMDFILSNTVVYKVGHHGSHNATLKTSMDRMSHDDLVAFIPVNRKDPNLTKANPWKMPAKNLYRELKKRTAGRIFRMDDGKLKQANVKWPSKPVVNALFVEYEVKD